jgi:hypothetical protein
VFTWANIAFGRAIHHHQYAASSDLSSIILRDSF